MDLTVFGCDGVGVAQCGHGVGGVADRFVEVGQRQERGSVAGLGEERGLAVRQLRLVDIALLHEILAVTGEVTAAAVVVDRFGQQLMQRFDPVALEQCLSQCVEDVGRFGVVLPYRQRLFEQVLSFKGFALLQADLAQVIQALPIGGVLLDGLDELLLGMLGGLFVVGVHAVLA